ncbi:hypothetical protein D3C81_2215980 [compost metagenome]
MTQDFSTERYSEGCVEQRTQIDAFDRDVSLPFEAVLVRVRKGVAGLYADSQIGTVAVDHLCQFHEAWIELGAFDIVIRNQ